MNKKLEVKSLRSLQQSLDNALANQQKCGQQVSAAKQTYFVNKDQPNAEALRDANLAFLAATGVTRKAREAIRIFRVGRMSLSQNGRLVRL